MEPLKEIEIDGKQYHIERFGAQAGSWLLMRFIKAFRNLIKDLEDEGVEGQQQEDDGKGDSQEFSENLLQTLITELDYDEFGKIQKHALMVVSRTDFVGEKPFQQPVILSNGKIAFADLKTDTGVVMSLTSQAIFANLAPFFTKTGLKAIMRGEIPTFSR